MKKITMILLSLVLMLSMVLTQVLAQDEDFDINIVNQKVLSSDINNLASRSFILLEMTTGQELFSKNADNRYPMASLTKIMTTYIIMGELAAGRMSFDDIITASEYACSFGGSQVWLEPGEQFTLREMLYAIELHSANDAAVAVAEAIAGNEASFVSLMNAAAEKLGMNDTLYRDCTGLSDEGHYSTARDTATLALALVNTYPEILEITSKIYEPFREGTEDQVDLYNRNKLIQYYSGATGLKTGFTTLAGHCLAATAERNGFKLVSVVMGADDTNTRFADSMKLLDYGFLEFDFLTIDDGGKPAGSIPVEKGIELEVTSYVEGDSTFLLKIKDFDRIERVVEIPDVLEAPVTAGTVIGKITYVLDGEELGSTAILTETGTEKAGFFKLLWRKILSWFGIVK
ncbi:MAG TPA: D-alanyl-D-alanine carboxypeptidase family protein [Clostridia bacterium]|nr:D-alanyl-D-alanine carboxypeptidase family protein [Clostridia bacterium]HPQ45788.1 D-alanyl-D-alanine carboxypeptidase family protein [Clostridia bacterium]HRX42077.1 D-alanyl-D-alanine carboxypeptidase family protein [Clostridia bacterium]